MLKENCLKTILKLIEIHRKLRENELNNINIELSNMLELHKNKSSLQLQLLKEQSALAKNLNIESNLLARII